MMHRNTLLLSLACCFALGTTAAADVPPGRYTVHDRGTGTLADDTVTDNRTGLTWQREVPNTAPGCNQAWCTRTQAIAYCETLELDGSGWRLPKISELLTIIDVTRQNPAIDNDAFPNTPNPEFFWSSTAYVGLSGFTWLVFFAEGTSDFYPNATESRVRCVR